MKLHTRLRQALLQASMLAAPASLGLPLVGVPTSAWAQALAPNAAPQGGQVVGGAASIGQSAATTTITQTTNRAAIDWQSFNVGRDHTVEFRQPSAQAMTLNRVVGPDPSVIAGHITANGGIALVNQSGVMFTGGAQVQAQSVIVSTADIATGAFMKGGAMAFDRPGQPGARIENRGTITAREAGLAALVAPQVANSGVIAAKAGTVVLAGATQHVIDLYGDGLVSFAIGAPVKQAPADGKALVSNTGTVKAEGGTVLLTAAAADGIVQQLVRAGGTVGADTSSAGQAGRVVLSGTGGAIVVEGRVSAAGRTVGTHGGSVTVNAERVLVTGTARIDASGRAGGGAIRVGTDGHSKAARTGIAAGAVLRADATGRGRGGTVEVNSRDQTVMAGRISARGGRRGGDGGAVEVSGGAGFRLTGTVDVSAPAGAPGQVLIDPATLTIVADGDARINVTGENLTSLILASGSEPADAYLAASVVGGIAGNLTLQASNAITVDSGITKPAGDLLFQSGTLLTVNAPVVLGAGDLTLSGTTIALNNLVQVAAAHQVILDNGGYVPGAAVTEAGAGQIIAGTLTQSGTSTFDNILLPGANQIATLNALYTNGTIAVTNVAPLNVTGANYGQGAISIDVRGGDLTIDTEASIYSYGPVQLRANGSVNLLSASNVTGSAVTIAAAFNFATGASDITGAGSIGLGGSVAARTSDEGPGIGAAALMATVSGPGTLTLSAGTGGIIQTGGTLYANTLQVESGGDAILTNALPWDGAYASYSSNQIGTLGPSHVAGNFALDTYSINFFGTYDASQDIVLSGAITVGGTLTLRGEQTGFTQEAGSVLTAARLNATAVDFGDLTLTGANRLASLGTISGNGVTIDNAASLVVAGPVSSAGTLGIVVSGGDITVSGSISAQQAVDLEASGSITVGAGAAISSSVEIGQSGIALLASTTGGTFSTTQAGGIQLAGTLLTSGDVGLSAGTGGITQTGGSVTAGRLVVQSGAQALLNGAGFGTPNQISTALLAGSAVGDFVLDNGSTDIIVTGGVSAANIRLRTTGALMLTSHCSGPFTSSCVSAPALLIANGGGRISLEAGSLAFTFPGNTATGGLVEIAPALSSALVVGGAAGSSVGGALSVNQDVLPAIKAPMLRLGSTTDGGMTATSINFAAPVGFAGTLDVQTSGNVTQSGKTSLTLGALSGVSLGAITLTEPTNTIGTIGDLSSAGPLSLTVAGTMALAGLLAAPGQAAVLVAPGGLIETGAGRILAGRLAAQSSGDIALGGSNMIGQLGPATAGGNFTLNNNGALTIPAGGPVSAGGTLAITTGGSLSLADTLSAGVVSLAAGSTISEAGGSITAGTLNATTTSGNITLGGGNTITALGTVQTPGVFLLADTVPLSVGAGAVVRGVAGITLDLVGLLTLDGTLMAPGAAIDIGAGSVAEGVGGGAAGAIQAGTLTIRGTNGDVALAGHNLVDSLGNSMASGNFTLADATALTIAAGSTITAGNTLALTSDATLAIGGQLGAAAVALAGASGISGAGVIVAPLLTATSTGGDVALTGANQVGSLGSSLASGNFALTDAVALTVAAGGTVTAGGTLALTSAATLGIAGQLGAASVVLSGASGISGAGVIVAPLLTATSTGGDVALTGPNQVGGLGSSSAFGNFTLVDAAALTVAAGSTVTAGGTLALIGDATLGIAGQLGAPVVSLVAGAGIAESGAGRVVTPLLLVSTETGDIMLGGANVIDALGAIAAPGRFLLADNVGLLGIGAGQTVSAAGGLTLTITGALTIDGTLSAPAAGIGLSAASIAEGKAGSIVANVLTAASTGGDVTLTGANQVASLGNSSAAGNFTLADTVALRVAGGNTVTAGGLLSLSSAGAFVLGGQLSAPSVQLVASAIRENEGGNIIAQALSATAGDGDIALGGANAVATLHAVTTPGNFTLNDTVTLGVPTGATVAAGGTALVTGGNDVIIDGHVTGGSLTLEALNLLQVNGFSALATSGPLILAGGSVVTTGLFGSPAGTSISAGTASLGGRVTGPSLFVNSPSITFTGLDAGGTRVTAALGLTGTASGTLTAGGLIVAGGSGATLFGSVGGFTGGQAAAHAERANVEGIVYPPPPPNPGLYTLNGCPIAFSVCHPLTVAITVPSVATVPEIIIAGMDPRDFSVLLTDSMLGLPTPTSVFLRTLPLRDPEDDVDLAPPNIRAEDF